MLMKQHNLVSMTKERIHQATASNRRLSFEMRALVTPSTPSYDPSVFVDTKNLFEGLDHFRLSLLNLDVLGQLEPSPLQITLDVPSVLVMLQFESCIFKKLLQIHRC